MTEHDWDGRGGCVPDCRTCRAEKAEAERDEFRHQRDELEREVARLKGEKR